MHRTTRYLTLIFLLLAGVAGATNTYVLAGEACTQANFRAQCPLAIDPNFAQFAVIGPVPHDPNTWEIPVGTFNRTLEICQDQGHPVDVAILDTNCDGSGMIQDPNSGAWKLTAEVLPGLRWWLIRATSIPLYGAPAYRDVLLVATVPYPPNTPPTIALHHEIQRLLLKKFVMACKREGWDGDARTSEAARSWLAARYAEWQS